MRLAIFTRRFWPHSSPAEMEVLDLAQELRSAGHQVRIFTVHWERNWPRTFQLREIPVVRIGRRLGNTWGMFRFVRELKHQIFEAETEGVIIYGLNEEAWGVIRSLVNELPSVVRVHWLEAAGFFERKPSLRSRIILGRARRLIADSTDTARLLSEGSPSLPAEIVPACAGPGRGGAGDWYGSSSGLSTDQARGLLSETHPILEVDSRQPLVVCGSSLRDPGVEVLLKAWQQLVKSMPNARLWLLGNGLEEREAWERVVQYGLGDSVVMPGFFDQLDEVLRAADLYLQMTTQGGDTYILSRAMALGLATISLPAESVHSLIRPGENGQIARDRSPESLSRLMLELLNDPELRRQLGGEAARGAPAWDLRNWAHCFYRPLQERWGLENDSGIIGETD